MPKFTSRTKYIGVKYLHFRKHLADGTIAILHIDTKMQMLMYLQNIWTRACKLINVLIVQSLVFLCGMVLCIGHARFLILKYLRKMI